MNIDGNGNLNVNGYGANYQHKLSAIAESLRYADRMTPDQLHEVARELDEVASELYGHAQFRRMQADKPVHATSTPFALFAYTGDPMGQFD